MKKAAHPKIAIVGRPNVGKSSLFNRIIGSRKAIVDSVSGTTRDRLHADIKWKGKTFTIVDTGGFEAVKTGDIARLVLSQLDTAIKEADIIFFVTDVSAGVVHQDLELSARLRKTSKRIYLVVNKADDSSSVNKGMEFFELGLGDPYLVSANNGTGIEKLLDDAAKPMEKTEGILRAASVKVAIVGRPNVGKSSYLNAILKEERVIVNAVAGTTRDSVDTDFLYKDRVYVLIDTAGMRHDAKITESADFYGNVRARESIKRCDVAIALIDGFEGLKEDDARIIDIIIKEGKALVIAVNKWDLTQSVATSVYSDLLIKKMNAAKNFPILFMSSKTGRGVVSSLDAIWSAYERSKTVLAPEEITNLRKALNGDREITGKRIKFLYLAQKTAQPPVFALGVKDVKVINQNTKKYVENFFRREHDFVGVPIVINYENSGGL
ncbi:MAG: ribosome biogenesis GTPase Der [Candidatus Omnitrophota bacterium]|nr:ribosome biogenesis GTPase Der [Candidatus Omnitrophota bacterium]